MNTYWRWYLSIISVVEMIGIGNRKRFRRVFFRKLSNPSEFLSIYHFQDGVRKAPIFWSLVDSMVEMMGFEPMTPCLQGRCSPSWATPPNLRFCFFLPVKSSLLRSKNFTLTKSKFHCRRQFHFGFAKISLRNKVSLGRPKWTRTTDLVLIRHAL